MIGTSRRGLDGVLFLVLSIYVSLFPFERILEAGWNLDTVWKPYRTAGILLVGLWGLAWMIGRRKIRLDFYDLAFGFIFLWGFLIGAYRAVLGEGNLDSSVRIGVLILLAFSAYVVVKHLRLSAPEIEKLLNLYLFFSAAAVCISWVAGHAIDRGRLEGYFSNPNQIGFAATVAVTVLVGRFFFLTRQRRPSPTKIALYGSAILACFVALGLSGSRAAIIAVVISVSVLVLTGIRLQTETKRTVTRLVVLTLFIIAGAALVSDRIASLAEETTVAERYEVESVVTLSGRYDIWRSALWVAADHQFLGVGMGQYVNYHRAYVARLPDLLSPGIHRAKLGTHSDWIDLITNYGIIPFVLFSWIAYRLTRRLWKRAIFGREDDSYLIFTGPALYAGILSLEVAGNYLTGGEFFFLVAVLMRLTALASPSLSSGVRTHGSADVASPREYSTDSGELRVPGQSTPAVLRPARSLHRGFTSP